MQINIRDAGLIPAGLQDPEEGTWQQFSILPGESHG